MKSYFSREIRSALNLGISEAKQSVTIAVAWFTDKILFESVLRCLQRGIKVKLYIRNDYRNNHEKAIDWQKYIDSGGILYFDNLQKLHHKFCIIDKATVFIGSYNWTLFAHFYSFESIVRIDDENVSDQFCAEFDNLILGLTPVENNIRISESETSNQESIIWKTEMHKEIDFEENKASEIDLERLLTEAVHQYNQKNYDEAEKLLNEINLIRPDESRVYNELSSIFWRKENYLKQFNLAKVAFDLAKDDIQKARALNSMGLSQYEIKNYSQAVNLFKQVVYLLPDDSVALWNKYSAEYELGHHRECDSTALEVRRVANNTIKKLKGISCMELLKARISFAHISYSVDKVDGRKRALLAKEVFYQLPEEERDYHDLDDIEELLKTNP
ncbi:MAG: phospholipase D-like domain-containing protein [Cytophagaceae bacterium]|nr:phospholipase D-like domain-containing protein [Cytophagaceae bacterium]